MSSAASSLMFSSLPSDLSTAQRRGLSAFVVAMHLALGWAWWHSKADSVKVGASEIIEVSLVTDAQSQTRDATEEPRPEPVRQPVQPQRVERVQPKLTPAPTPAQPSPTPPVLTSQSGTESVAANAPAVAPAATPVSAQPAPAAVAAPAPPPPAPRELQVSAVSYLVPPVLTYPRISRDQGEQGTVLLRVLVDERGRPAEIVVAKSSGYTRLDHQAVVAMRAARFKPYIDNGVPRSAWVPAPLAFNLEDN